MKKSEQKQFSENAKFLKTISNKSLSESAKSNMEDNMKSAFIGGGVGVLIGIATKGNLLMYGIGGLILGRLLLKIT